MHSCRQTLLNITSISNGACVSLSSVYVCVSLVYIISLRSAEMRLKKIYTLFQFGKKYVVKIETMQCNITNVYCTCAETTQKSRSLTIKTALQSFFSLKKFRISNSSEITAGKKSKISESRAS